MIMENEIDNLKAEIKNKQKKNKRGIVYTAIFGKYDALQEPLVIEKDIDYLCITDQVFPVPYPWRCIIIKTENTDKVRLNRLIKINPHLFFPEYAYSLYVDGNIIINCSISELAEKILPENSVILVRHPLRNCIYQEALECIKKSKDDTQTIESQMREYREEGFPEAFGLSENNILLRDHNNPIVVRLMEAWWNEINQKSRRDQLSLFYVIWKQDFKVHFFPESISLRTRKPDRKLNASFLVGRHLLRRRKMLRRNYILVSIYVISYIRLLVSIIKGRET